MRRQFYLILFCLCLAGCISNSSVNKKELIIFHAGSLSVPFRELSDKYMDRNPGVNILLEPAGSLVCARKVTELKKPCDILASADYLVIDELLIPDFASWGIRFATNEIVIAFNERSKYSSEIDSSNWIDILLRDDVIYSRSDPDSDPCGYRSVLTFMLSENYYKRPGIAGLLTEKNREFIRPKEVDLVALLQSNAVDYMMQYKSVAIQHKLKFIELPDEVNLSDPMMNDRYGKVSLEVAAGKPGSKMIVRGEYINYSLTIIKDSPSSAEAEKFIDYMIGEEGQEIFRMNGQEPIIPFTTQEPDRIPVLLKKRLESSKKPI